VRRLRAPAHGRRAAQGPTAAPPQAASAGTEMPDTTPESEVMRTDVEFVFR